MKWILVDRIDELQVGKSARGGVRFDPSLELFEDHFPSFPVVPGVVLVEAMAQLSGKLIGWTVRQERGDWPFPILSMANGVKFRRFVRPDQEVELRSTLTSLRDEMAHCKVEARVDGKRHANAELMFVFNPEAIDDMEDRSRVEDIERAHLKRMWADYPD